MKRFPESESSRQLKADLIKSTRPEELFFTECLEIAPGNIEPSRNLFTQYDTWCEDRNHHFPLTENVFVERLLKYFPNVIKDRFWINEKRVTAYRGLKLLPDTDGFRP